MNTSTINYGRNNIELALLHFYIFSVHNRIKYTDHADQETLLIVFVYIDRLMHNFFISGYNEFKEICKNASNMIGVFFFYQMQNRPVLY